MADESAALEPDLRADLERVLRRLVDAGKIPSAGERELRIRVDGNGRVKWFEPTAIRVPASELSRGFDETAG